MLDAIAISVSANMATPVAGEASASTRSENEFARVMSSLEGGALDPSAELLLNASQDQSPMGIYTQTVDPVVLMYNTTAQPISDEQIHPEIAPIDVPVEIIAAQAVQSLPLTQNVIEASQQSQRADSAGSPVELKLALATGEHGNELIDSVAASEMPPPEEFVEQIKLALNNNDLPPSNRNISSLEPANESLKLSAVSTTPVIEQQAPTEELALNDTVEIDTPHPKYEDTTTASETRSAGQGNFDNQAKDDAQAQGYAYKEIEEVKLVELSDNQSEPNFSFDAVSTNKSAAPTKLFSPPSSSNPRYSEFRENNYESIKSIIEANAHDVTSGKASNRIVKFELNPQDLGSIEIRFENDEILSRTKVSIISQRYQTHEIMQKLSSEIESILQANNSSSQDVALNFSLNHNTKNFNTYVKSLESDFQLAQSEEQGVDNRNYVSAFDYTNLNLEQPISILA